ncbi:hypothetical protein ACQ4LE_004720, partial [Meloidogyne hapla]
MPFQKPVAVKVDNKQIPPNFIRPLRDKRALIGQRIVLECQIDGHPDPVIKWLKDGHNVSQCPDYELSELGKTYRLTVHKAQAADCGRFTIQAMNAVGIKQSSCVLIVAPAPTPIPGAVTSVTSSPAPPQTPVGPSAPLFIKELKHQPLRLGTASVFEARVVGVPMLTIEWLKDGEPLDNYRIKTEYDAHSGISLLQIPQMFAEDVGEYTCKATNDIGLAQSSAKLLTQEEYENWFSKEQAQFTLDKKERLLQAARRQIQQQSVGRKNNQQIQKSIISPRSTPSYIQRQLDHLKQQQQSLAQINTSSLFYDNGYNISAQRPLPSSLASHQLQKSSIPFFRNELRGMRLFEGTDAILQCETNLDVSELKIFWLFNGLPLAPNPRIQTHYDGTLALMNITTVDLENSGEYSIIAENQHGRAQSSARVEVYPLSSNNQIITPQSDNHSYILGHINKKISQLPRHIVSPDTHIRQQQKLSVKQINQAPLFVPQRSLEQEIKQNQHQLSHPQKQELDYKLQEPTVKEFRLRTPPREQYQIRERNTVINRGDLHIIPQSQQKNTPQIHHPKLLDYQHSPHKSQSTSEWEINQWLFDLYFDKGGSPTKIHPYLRPPEQVEYFLQQQNRQLERQLSKMAPPKLQKNGPMANGTAVQQKSSGSVSGNVKPPQFVEMPKPLAVKPGDKAVFTAKAEGQPVPELTWTSLSQPHRKLTAELKKFQIADGKDGQSRFTILSVQEKDLGVYACVASNPGGSFQAQFALQFADES